MILELASKVILSQDLGVHSTFLNLTRQIFHSEAATFDPFKPEGTVQDINRWVESKTHGNIQNILNPGLSTTNTIFFFFSFIIQNTYLILIKLLGDIDHQTCLVLLNAVYFKAAWAFPINPRNTFERNFHLNPTHQKKVPTMFLMGSFVSGEIPELDADFAVIPYEDEKFNMILIVPKRIDGLRDIENNLQLLNVSRLMGYSRNTIQVFLPKFKVHSTLNLQKPLKDVRIIINFHFL